MNSGDKIYNLIRVLWPINRSLTGNGNRKTLKILKNLNSKLKIKEVTSGTRVYDWKIPLEWNVKKAYIKDINTNRKIVDFNNNNLHLMGYSIPIKKKILNFNQLNSKINFIKSNPDAIPYTTSYYKKDWSFNISYNSFKKINRSSKFLIFIDTQLKRGSMSYGEILIKGKSSKEFLISTYICHPSMANNELSGPALSIFLSKWLRQNGNNFYSYRFIFIPETIGSIYYINKNLLRLKKNTLGIFNVTCVGDESRISFLPTKYQNTFLDRLVIKYLKSKKIKHKKYSWKDRGSDERQYMSALVNIPTISIMSSKYHTYKEYHTSKDDLNFVTKKGLNKNFKIYKDLIKIIDKSRFPISQVYCEPNLGKRQLYPTKSTLYKSNKKLHAKAILNFLSYSDGNNTLEDISDLTNKKINETKKIYKELFKYNLIKYLT